MKWYNNLDRQPNKEEILKHKGHFICTYLVCDRYYVGELYYNTFNHEWYDLFHYKRKVIAWQELPDIYKEG